MNAITPRLVSEEEALGLAPSRNVPEALQGLAARIQAATGPDRVLDVLLNVLTGDRHDDEADARRMVESYEADPTGYAEDRYTTTGADEWGVPRYTASLDAALALVERVNRSWCWRVEKLTPAGAVAFGGAFWATCGEAGGQEAATGPTPALALLSALLAALANRPEKPE